MRPRRSQRRAHDALELLGPGGCVTCRFRDAASENFFGWFRIETHAQPSMIERLRASRGMCPPHTRRLLGETTAAELLTGTYLAVVSAADPRLEPPGECPACATASWATRHVEATLLPALSEPDVADAFAAGDGFCLAHARQAIARTRDRDARLIGETLARALDRAEGARLRELLAATDRDAGARTVLRRALPDELSPATPRSTIGRVRLQLRTPACPLCLGRGRMERRYLSWVTGERGTETQSTVGDVAFLCAGHLHDVAGHDDAAGMWATELQRAAWTGELDRFLERLRRPSPSNLLSRMRSGRAVDEACGSLPRERPCAACRAASVTEQREAQLLVAALADDATARRYERSQGLCLRHVRSLAHRPHGDLLHRVAEARLAVLAWELEEAERKRAWSYRHESTDAESDAWLRAPAQLDGRVFMGGPAVRLRSPGGASL